ncbi:MAG TPA: nuclear transport factor 2 family protein [Xanthobacteraceae bacterium]|jgi:hypothetical protein|nr:nuclear transport factor 2 family protein [Xanthobacteraceae bacterium]
MGALTTVKRFYTLLATGNLAAALQLLDPAIEWTEAERTPYYAGTMRGVDAVVAGLFKPLANDFADFATTPSEFVADKSRVVSIGRYTGVATTTNKALSVPFVHLWTVENDQLRKFRQFTDSGVWIEALTR